MKTSPISTAAATLAFVLAGAGTASAQAPSTCTWGGTIAAATGQNHIDGSLSNAPSTEPLHFHATGPLGGQCEGTFVFDGWMDAGATCSYITFHARTHGLRGVRTVEGTAVAGFAPARLYDRDGNVVGSENANFLSDPSIVPACNTPQGITDNPFSSVIELFGQARREARTGARWPTCPSAAPTVAPRTARRRDRSRAACSP